MVRQVEHGLQHEAARCIGHIHLAGSVLSLSLSPYLSLFVWYLALVVVAAAVIIALVVVAVVLSLLWCSPSTSSPGTSNTECDQFPHTSHTRVSRVVDVICLLPFN